MLSYNNIVLHACQLFILYMRNPFIIYVTRHLICIIKYRFGREIKSSVFMLKLESLPSENFNLLPRNWCIHSSVVTSWIAPAICYFLNKSTPFQSKNWLFPTSTDIPDLSMELCWINALLWHDSFLSIWRQFVLNCQLCLFDMSPFIPRLYGLELKMSNLLLCIRIIFPFIDLQTLHVYLNYLSILR